MSEMFAPLFEFGDLYTAPYSQLLFSGVGYTLLGLSFILIPLVVMFLFYYAWNPVFGRWYHWLTMVAVAFLITLGTAYGVISAELVRFYGDTEFSDVESFTWIISFLTGGYAIVLAVFWSFVIRFKSTNNSNNPLATKFF